ncbi:hypothetical protein [Actinomyces wuliandei]|nr:hypothetical protein [Actinomyces wuliandei]
MTGLRDAAWTREKDRGTADAGLAALAAVTTAPQHWTAVRTLRPGPP